VSAGGNDDQVAFWNGDAGERWVAAQERMDALFADLTGAALDAAGVRPGERVIDVGCGCGGTVLGLAERVGPAGSVLGVDVSRPMLDRAGARVRALGLGQVRLELADAAAYPFQPASADLVFSRFGVMFFHDPAAAFANLRRALLPGGRLTFVCWQALDVNPFFLVPLAAARPFAPPAAPLDPHAPGPFAFADPARVKTILETAGYRGVRIGPLAALMRLGAAGEDFDEAASRAIEFGPVSRLLAEADAAARAQAFAAVRAALAAEAGPDGVVLGARLWLVGAEV
jgi:SAM-dependent methyltransferase